MSADDQITCEWFAMCDRPAMGTVEHPTLGEVPVCERCAERMEIRHFLELFETGGQS